MRHVLSQRTTPVSSITHPGILTRSHQSSESPHPPGMFLLVLLLLSPCEGSELALVRPPPPPPPPPPVLFPKRVLKKVGPEPGERGRGEPARPDEPGELGPGPAAAG